ncbi:hypothetical protein QQF64_017455 [Cirrhinus molitorella]|uniref:Uncharacterized protein n=1 Tax=Cirrhinus molitorella TaxID=172907 RepID=A0ABR3LMC2_9TELE
MKPVSMALNVLQSETNTQMGWQLPTIYLLDSKLKKMEASIKVCILHHLDAIKGTQQIEAQREASLLCSIPNCICTV